MNSCWLAFGLFVFWILGLAAFGLWAGRRIVNQDNKHYLDRKKDPP